MNKSHQETGPGKRLILIGLGNTGSGTASYLARFPGISILLIDGDSYVESNLSGQSIDVRALGRPKVDFFRKDQIPLISPGNNIVVDSIQADVRHIPLSTLLGEDIVAVILCVDNNHTRYFVSRILKKFGARSWLLDAGVRGDASLARVTVIPPGANSACLECNNDPGEYENLIEQVYPCAGREAVPASASPAWLGGLAASLLVSEISRILAGERNGDQASTDGEEVIVNARQKSMITSRIKFNPACPSDGAHEPRALGRLGAGPGEINLGQALNLGDGDRLRLAGGPAGFARKLFCPNCGRERKILYLVHRLRSELTTCSCGARLAARGFDFMESLGAELSEYMERPLQTLGFHSGDILEIGQRYYVLT